MAQISVWLGAGAVAAGVSAAMIAGADVASADTGSSDSSKSSSDSSSKASSKTSKVSKSTKARSTTKTNRNGPRRSVVRTRTSSSADRDETNGSAITVSSRTKESTTGAQSARAAKTQEPTAEAVPTATTPTDPTAATPEPAVTDGAPIASVAPQSKSLLGQRSDTRPVAAAKTVTLQSSSVARTAATTAPVVATEPRTLTLAEHIQSFVFDFIGVGVTAIAGPPTVPAGSNVTVQRSTLEITEGRNVPAHWYYPEGDEPPERMILLQHGFLGVSSMYSHTAANLAERTNSIVVVPTYSSNRYVADGFWLGDDQLYRATADLFLGDREALTASALAGGYAEKYGAGVALPDAFVMVGHSLGAGVVAGAAGYYADAVTASGADNHLAGLVLLDGAPPGTSLSDALDKLDQLDTYIPVLELGAPKESRRVDAALLEHRPGMFNGMVLADGTHLDAMQGGSLLIRLMSYLMYDFPTAQNKSASQTLITGWVDDMFAGRFDASTGACDADCTGLYGEPGDSIVLPTPDGDATAVVIGGPATAPLTTEFQPSPATALLAARPPVAIDLRV